MYLDTPQSSSLVKIQLAFCSQESLVFDCVGSCCFKSKRLLTKPLPSKQQIYGPPVRRRLWNVVFLIHFQECSSGGLVSWVHFLGTSWNYISYLNYCCFESWLGKPLCNPNCFWIFLWFMMAIFLLFYDLSWPYRTPFSLQFRSTKRFDGRNDLIHQIFRSIDSYVQVNNIRYSFGFISILVCASPKWNKNPTLSQNHNLPTYVLLFLPPRLLYLFSHFLLSHYPPYIPSHYFSQKPPLTYLPTYVPACLPLWFFFLPP